MIRHLAAALAVALAAPVVAHTQVLLGPDFQVNTYTTSIQSYPAVVAAADAGFVVLWQSLNQAGSSSGNDVFARRYNTYGQALGQPFRVNTYTAGQQYQVGAASGAAGDFVVVWSSSHDGGGFGVFAQRFDAAGVAQGSEFRVNEWTTGTQAFPAVAADADGAFVIAWRGAGATDSRWDLPAGATTRAGSRLDRRPMVNAFTTGCSGRPVGRIRIRRAASSWSGTAPTSRPTDPATACSRRGSTRPATKLGTEFLVNTHTTSIQSRPPWPWTRSATSWWPGRTREPPETDDVFARRFVAVGRRDRRRVPGQHVDDRRATRFAGRRQRPRRLRRVVEEPVPGRPLLRRVRPHVHLRGRDRSASSG